MLEISKFEKPPNIIAAKYSRFYSACFTSTKYNVVIYLFIHTGVLCMPHTHIYIYIYIVKRLFIGDDLFGEILKKIAKISCCQIKTSQSLDIPVLEISKFEKPPNIIAAKYSRFYSACFTSTKYNVVIYLFIHTGVLCMPHTYIYIYINSF